MTKPIGDSLAHDSAALHVSGEAVYIDDIPLPADGLYGALGLSNRAHADFTMDVSAVCHAADVVAVATAKDIPGINDIAPVIVGDPLFAEKTVEYVGQSLLAVAATNEKSARRAACLAAITYRDKAAILSIEEALAKQSFLSPPENFFTLQRGDFTAAIDNAPHQLSGVMRTGAQEHFYLEGQAAIALPQENGDMIVHSSTQNPTEIQKLVADVLALTMNQISVETRRLGGGFGGKETQAALIACAAAVLAKMTNKAVKLRLPRADDFIATGKRHPFLGRYRVGFDYNGRITGVDIELAADCGMSADLSHAIIRRAVFHADNVYHYPAVRITGIPCKTNKASNTAFRGFGGPQGMLLAEKMMGDIARFLKKDALAIRLLNTARHGQKTPYGQRLRHPPTNRLFNQLVKQTQYQKARRTVEHFNQQHHDKKQGIAITPVKFGISFTTAFLNQAGALLQVYHDGSVALNHGGTEMGQGLFIKVAQVAASTLGIPIEAIRCQPTTTTRVPNTSATAASSGTDLNGMAVYLAAKKIRHRLATIVASDWQCPMEQITFSNGIVRYKKQHMTFIQLVSRCYHQRISLSASGYYRTPRVHFDDNTATGHPFFYYAYGVAASIAEIDTQTGENRLLSVDILHDVGNSINPAIDLGQIEGGFIQGWGWLSMEEVVWNSRGALTTTGPATYKIPAAGDTPEHFKVHLWQEANDAPTIMRSKAVGEPPLMLAISGWSAIADAVNAAGGRADWLPAPATAENILAAINGNTT